MLQNFVKNCCVSLSPTKTNWLLFPVVLGACCQSPINNSAVEEIICKSHSMFLIYRQRNRFSMFSCVGSLFQMSAELSAETCGKLNICISRIFSTNVTDCLWWGVSVPCSCKLCQAEQFLAITTSHPQCTHCQPSNERYQSPKLEFACGMILPDPGQ